jgi:hypothetical protein
MIDANPLYREKDDRVSGFEKYLLAQPGGEKYVRQARKKGEPLLVSFLNKFGDRLPPEKVEGMKRQGMKDGSLELTHEGAVQFRERIKKLMEQGEMTADAQRFIEQCDPLRDADIITAAYLSLNPEVIEAIGGASNLYRTLVEVGSANKKGYGLAKKPRRPTNGDTYTPLDGSLENLLRSMPDETAEGKNEADRRLLSLCRTKAERDAFVLFQRDPKKAGAFLEELVEKEESAIVREVYRGVKEAYASYDDLEVLDVNPEFCHPKTGEKGTLPALHQKMSLYHQLKERKYGVFDGCGTGKTAIATLAKPLIDLQMDEEGVPYRVDKNEDGKQFRRTVVVGPKLSRKSWKKGLTGKVEERYLESTKPEDVMIVDPSRKKDESFLEELAKKEWIVLNYEQLQSNCADGRSMAQVLVEMGVDYVVVDESHRARGRQDLTPQGKLTQSAAVRALANSAPYLSLLSATPIVDTTEDYAVPAHLLNPDLVPDIRSFGEIARGNPRIVYTLFLEKTSRKTAEEINPELNYEEEQINVELDPLQKKIHDHLIDRKPRDWLIQTRKAILDPRLVDPEVLKRAGVLGEVTWRNSSKYKTLIDRLTDEDGPVAKGEKFVIFSSLFRDGVMYSEAVEEKEHAALRERYESMGLAEEYEKLGLDKSLDQIVEEALHNRFGNGHHIGVIDGTITDIGRREEMVDDLHNGLTGILCTTDAGGESLEYTAATRAYFLDRKYTLTSTQQGIGRLVRPGQENDVTIEHLVAEDSVEEIYEEASRRKDLVNRMATDGYELTEWEREFLENKEGIDEYVERRLGGKSIDVFDVTPEDITDFRAKKNTRRPGGVQTVYVSNGSTTEAQKIAAMIGRDGHGVWFDPEFVELYMKNLQHLSVPILHQAKVLDLVRRANEGQIDFPGRVLSEGAGPSLLYNAYQRIEPILGKYGLERPFVVDRDISHLMLTQGENPNRIIGNMTGENSAIATGSFDMVDNESITLLSNEDEVKASLIEANRVLREGGTLELLAKNTKFHDGSAADIDGFKPDFYKGIGELGFELLTEKNIGLGVHGSLTKRMVDDPQLGRRYATAFANKLQNTSFLIARKTGSPDSDADARHFWFASPQSGDKTVEADLITTGKTDTGIETNGVLEERKSDQVRKSRRDMLRRRNRSGGRK